MAISLQYDFFESQDENFLIKKEIDALNKQLQNVRKGIFSRHNELEKCINKLLKMYLDQEEEISRLRSILHEIKNG